MTENTATTTWPYCPGSGLIGRDLAENIRTWALTVMSEAELRSYSQRQLLSMYHLATYPAAPPEFTHGYTAGR